MSQAKSSTKHKLYKQMAYTRRLVKDCVYGPDAIKRANELYLPIPAGFLVKENDAPPFAYINGNGKANPLGFNIEDTPFFHNNKAYMAYLHRARFPDFAKHALVGLVGTAARKDPEYKLPSKIAYLEEHATKNGKNIKELFSFLVCEILCNANAAIAVEIDPESNTLYFVIYQANHNINWRFDEAHDFIEMSVFEYMEESQTDDPFESEDKIVTIAYRFMAPAEKQDSLFVSQQRFVDGIEETTIVPNLQGTPFEEIPVVYVGAVENTPTPQTPPILSICEISLDIYRKDADLAQAEHMTCNPNLVISGVPTESSIANIVGSTVALILDDHRAKAYYTETDTSALDHCDKRIQSLKEEALMLGLSLTGPSKKGVESVETVKARQNAQGATLVDVVRNVAKGIEKALEIAATISGASPDECEFIANIDFTELNLSPQMLQALNQACMLNNLSLESLLENMKEAGLIKDVKEELARLAAQGPREVEVAPAKKEEK